MCSILYSSVLYVQVQEQVDLDPNSWSQSSGKLSRNSVDPLSSEELETTLGLWSNDRSASQSQPVTVQELEKVFRGHLWSRPVDRSGAIASLIC